MLIYVASPYSHPLHIVRDQRYKKVMYYCAELIDQGHVPFSPIVYAHPMSNQYNIPTDAAHWEKFNLVLLRKSDVLHIYRMDGWEESKGVTWELKTAKELGIPVVEVDVIT